MQDTLSDSEALVEGYLEAGQKDVAVELLYKLAILSAKKKNFIEAEGYRDRLFEVDSMASSKIADVNEAIEQEKKKVLTPGFRQMWAPFFEILSPQEANTFFFALREQTLESEDIVLEQGKPNDRLYLVNQGQLKVVYSDQEKEFLIHTMGPGDYFGQDTFFSLNVCTASVNTLSDASLSFVERSTLNRMQGVLTSLEPKIKKVCRSGMSTFDRLRQKGLDRRSFERINFNTQVSFQLLASKNQEAMKQSVKADLWDISKAGLSFYFQSKNREAVRQLIGRKIGVRLGFIDRGRSKTIVVTGVVHGVEAHPLDEYSIHVKLDRHFSDAAINTIHGIADQ